MNHILTYTTTPRHTATLTTLLATTRAAMPA